MKKAFSLFLALAMCLSLCACGHTHEFGEWTVTAEANCTTDGSRERVCECGEKETEVLNATGHKYGDIVELKTATCTEDGQSEKTCTVCGETVTETEAALGHSFKAATLFRPKTCSTCGLTEGEALAKVISVGDTIEAEDHKFSVSKVDFTKDLKVKKGNVTYHHSSNGHVMTIKLNFTNLSTEALDRWNSDRIENISLEYMGKYNYEGEYWVAADDIVPLASDDMYIVFEIPESMSKDTTSSILVTFTIDDEEYAMTIQEGEGTSDDQADSGEAADVSGSINLGDSKTNDSTFAFVVDDLYYTKKPSYKKGNTTYSYGQEGYYLICKLDFTNLASETMDGWNSDRVTDMVLTYADKYTYEGQCWIPEHEIVPLDNNYLFVMFAVSENVETGSESLSFTFTVDGSEFTYNVR